MTFAPRPLYALHNTSTCSVSSGLAAHISALAHLHCALGKEGLCLKHIHSSSIWDVVSFSFRSIREAASFRSSCIREAASQV